jgi:hypothetical protein
MSRPLDAVILDRSSTSSTIRSFSNFFDHWIVLQLQTTNPQLRAPYTRRSISSPEVHTSPSHSQSPRFICLYQTFITQLQGPNIPIINLQPRSPSVAITQSISEVHISHDRSNTPRPPPSPLIPWRCSDRTPAPPERPARERSSSSTS